MATNGSLNRKLRMALVGGGQGAFIGRVHATAAVLDNRAALVAGACRAIPSGPRHRPPTTTFQPIGPTPRIGELVQKEKALPADQRIDFVSVATPNHTHFEIAKAAVEAGFNVICDKPMTFDLAQAEELAEAVDKSGVVFAVTHNYTGYPLVRQAREMILSGELGEINAIRSNYIQGWLRTRLENDATRSRPPGEPIPPRAARPAALATSRTHAYNLARYMTGLLPAEISCHLKIVRAGPRSSTTTARPSSAFENGALGTVTASQISHGRENDLFIEIDGTKGALEWQQEEPNKMYRRAGTASRTSSTPAPAAPICAQPPPPPAACPADIPKAFFEAFANVYRSAYDAMVTAGRGQAVREDQHGLSQRQRRRRRDVLHPAMRGQQQAERCLAAVGPQARPKVDRRPTVRGCGYCASEPPGVPRASPRRGPAGR